MNKKRLVSTLCAVTFALSACSDTANNLSPGSESPPSSEAVTDNNQEEQVIHEARNLFHNLINIGANDSEEEMKEIIEENLYYPAEYLESLVDNHLTIEYGNYVKATSAHREETLKRVRKGHYVYSAHVAIDMQEDKSNQTITSYAVVNMELKEKDGSLKITKLDLRPSGE